MNADTGHGSPPGAVTVIWDCLIAGADPTEGKDLPMPPTYNVTVITSVRAQQGRGKKGGNGSADRDPQSGGERAAWYRRRVDVDRS